MSDIRNIALSLYKPPFKYVRGYIYDADSQMLADDGFGETTVETALVARIRGWGKISYLKDAELIQDEVGKIIADALTAYYENLEIKQNKDKLGGV